MDWWDPQPRYQTIVGTREDGGPKIYRVVDRWPLLRQGWDLAARFVARHWQFTIMAALTVALLVVAIVSYLHSHA